jgi:protein involved in polysaccharide export with SLBB domain
MRLLHQDMPRYVSALCALFLAAMLAGCFTDSQPNKPPPPHDPTQDPLRIGDRIKVELTGIPDSIPALEQDIKEDGSINLPYVGRVIAAGKSPSKFEQELTAKYLSGYFTHISVTVTPVARFFYVGGQVNNTSGGRIIYTGPITVMGAIQAAGDFTPFSDRKHVQVTRVDGTIVKVNCIEAIKHPEKDIPIYPGDRIWVGRRF